MGMRLRLAQTQERKAVPMRVDFFGNPADLLCFTFAMAGISTNGIMDALRGSGYNLTESQINYRVGMFERQRRKGSPTQRRLFRDGKSPVSQALVAQIVGNRGLGQTVKATAISTLKDKHLYGVPVPKGNGIMRDEPGLRLKRA